MSIKSLLSQTATLQTMRAWRVLACSAALCAWAQSAQAAPEITHWTLENGAGVYLMHTDALPIVDVKIDFDAGTRRNPKSKAGLATVTADMLNNGVNEWDGLPAKNQADLSVAWAEIGAEFGVSASSERFSMRLRSLSAPPLLKQALHLAQQQIAEPAWDKSVWQRQRERSIASLREANTRPATIARKAYMQAVYGDHPYGYEVTEATLGAIGIADMQSFYRNTVRACDAKVSIVGAVSKSEATQLANSLLSALPSSQAESDGSEKGSVTVCEPLPVVDDVLALSKANDVRIPFKAAQAHIYVGQPGYKRSDPDHLALYVGNYVLGAGGFSSLLMEEVREKRGLTYGVGSGFNAGLNNGAFTIGLQTKPDQAGQALEVVQNVLREFVAKGPTDAQLRDAKDNIANSMGLRTDSNAKLLGYLAYIAWHDLPLTYLEDWPKTIEAVTKPQVQQAFARVLQSERMVTVVVGAKNTDAFNK